MYALVSHSKIISQHQSFSTLIQTFFFVRWSRCRCSLLFASVYCDVVLSKPKHSQTKEASQWYIHTDSRYRSNKNCGMLGMSWRKKKLLLYIKCTQKFVWTIVTDFHFYTHFSSLSCSQSNALNLANLVFVLVLSQSLICWFKGEWKRQEIEKK